MVTMTALKEYSMKEAYEAVVCLPSLMQYVRLFTYICPVCYGKWYTADINAISKTGALQNGDDIMYHVYHTLRHP
jgi:hypothetical protein